MNTAEKRNKITVSIAGCGTTGLLSASLWAEASFKTIIIDSDHRLTSITKKGKPAFPGDEIARSARKHLKSGGLTVTSNVKEASSRSSVLIIVNSPLIDEKKKPDYTLLEKVSKEIGAGLQPFSLVLVEGIVGPGVTETLVKESLQKASGLKAGSSFFLAFTPNVTSEAFKDSLSFPRIVGASDEKSLEAASLFLKSVSKSQIVAVKSIKTAETIGMFKSVQEDVNHALSIEFAHFCEEAGVDFTECQKVMGAYPSFTLPAANVAKKYFSSEPYLLFEEADNSGSLLRLSEQARKINEEMLRRTFHMVKESLKSSGKVFRKARITVLGISERVSHEMLNYYFSRNLVASLTKNGARIRVYDPFFSVKELTDLGFQAESTLGRSIEGADCLVIAVGHERFKRLNLKRIGFLMKQPAALIDVGNVVDPERARREGFIYRGFGRG